LPNAHAGLLTLKYNFFAERFSRGLLRIFVSYQRVLADRRREVARIERALGTDLSPVDAAAIDGFLTSDLHRQHRHGNDAPDIDPPALAEVFRIFMAAARDKPLDVAALDRLFASYIAYGRIWPKATESFLMHYRSHGKRDDPLEVETYQRTETLPSKMSSVIDRPDRRLFFLRRLRNYLTRAHSHRGITRSAAKLSRDFLVAKISDLRERASPRLRHHPLNPAHSLWRELVEVSGFPFLKTELLLRNPIGISDLDTWRLLLPPRELGQTIETHLALMRRGHDPRF
jgi:hypothetical protein